MRKPYLNEGMCIQPCLKHIFSQAQPDITIPPPSAPPTLPQGKPGQKGIQQSFLSGAAMAQQAGAGVGGGTGGKTLLGQ